MTRPVERSAPARAAAAPSDMRSAAGKALLPMLAAAALSVSAPNVAEAQAWNAPGQWVSINARQANLDHRIDVGVRNGQLNRREAARLRTEFHALARLETQYRRGGLTRWERTDLDRRFDRLAAQIRVERRDRQNVGRW
ncbi:hypothetical protein [Brevundimonas lutea]|uniref:hypothetical protein n=1 Tax=Brevundimonas lutea TaxID=2293980 RepID=UPI001F0C11CF|nr:hypothetical protein [Brevundimonas lutea]